MRNKTVFFFYLDITQDIIIIIAFVKLKAWKNIIMIVAFQKKFGNLHFEWKPLVSLKIAIFDKNLNEWNTRFK